MAHTNQTPNYELSQFLGTDKPAWLVDYNGDMEKIDLGLKAAKDVADAAKTEADQGATDIAAVTITANSADAKATGAVSDLAEAYDSTSTYNVGDFVIYGNILYKCITAITVPESFDGAHWARTTVEEIIAQVNSDLSNKLDKTWVSRGSVTGNIGVGFTGEFTDIFIKVTYSNDYMFTMFIPKAALSSTYNFYREGDARNTCRIGVKQDGAYVSDLYLDDTTINYNTNCTIEVFTR